MSPFPGGQVTGAQEKGGEYGFKCLLSGSEADNTTAPFGAVDIIASFVSRGNNTPAQSWASYIKLGVDEPSQVPRPTLQ